MSCYHSQIGGLPAFLGNFCDRAQTSALFLPRPTTSEPSPFTCLVLLQASRHHLPDLVL
ncbi:hypothetical protein DPMN_118992 [Dreissena polymorpha]|uniref:Uncharacterized protein n=1 Tax=Dreissena polymorpha TaxID=45954 RepID=A0A9D4GHH1_DREPO|nr:hypothetical protein DPMN_118992 [Dreissena polymorpha]